MSSKLKPATYICAALIATSIATAQAPPAPQQLTTAHTIFITNSVDANNEIAKKAYADFSASLSKRNHFRFSSKPEDADVILQFSVRPHVAHTEWNTALLQLQVLDPKTQAIFWSATEVAENINTAASVADKILASAADQLAEDFDAAAQHRSAVHPKKKSRFQQE